MVERVVVGPWRTNSYIYSSAKKECIIIDPGGDEVEIASRVDVLNMVPVGIALTHGHVDHVAALGRLKASYEERGYSLPVAIHSSDRVYLGAGGMDIHRESLEFLGMDEMGFFGSEFPGLPKADVRLRAGDRVFNMDIVVLETPGHTPGSVCFYSEKEGVLFSGDTMFFDGMGRTDLPGGSEKKLRESIEKTIMTLPPETRVFPGHGPFTTIEREKRGNAFFRAVAAQEEQKELQKAVPSAPASPIPSKPAGKKPAQKKLLVKKVSPKKPAPKKPAQTKPASKKPAAGKSTVKKLAAKKPAAKRPSKPARTVADRKGRS
ncbi:MAG: MBL fold metallo-hydrolase [Spirochaetes bacterium]|nr:MBL fold metallo-hydrolase [Spirochaetota bacterium]